MPNSPRRKIAVLASTLAVGGAERQLASLTRGLTERGHAFHFFFLKRAGAVGEELKAAGRGAEEDLLGRPARWLGAVAELSGFDLILALDHNNVLKLLPAFARRLPPYIVLYHVQGKPPPGWARALKGAAAVVAVASSQVPLLAGKGMRVEVIANGVPVPPAVGPADRNRARERLGLPTEGTIAAVVSRLSPEKGVDILLEAAARLAEPDRPFLIIGGDGPERESLASYAEENLRAGYTFLGELAEVAPVYRAADFFVLPSRRESAPLALLEAMAHGLPAVAAAVGDVPAIMAEGGGVTFTPGATAELAKAVKAFTADDPEAREERGRAARANVARRYSLNRMLEAYEELIGKVGGGGKADGEGDA